MSLPCLCSVGVASALTAAVQPVFSSVDAGFFRKWLRAVEPERTQVKYLSLSRVVTSRGEAIVAL